MNKKLLKTFSDAQGQGLVEYVILIAAIGILTILGLTLFGGSVKGGLLKICAAMGNPSCLAAESATEVTNTVDVTPTMQEAETATPVVNFTATPQLSEPDPTRESVPPGGGDPSPTPAQSVVTMRVKVVLNGKDSDNRSLAGVRVVIYDSEGRFVAHGVTDEKGNVSFSVPIGSYTISTYYGGTWQKDGPVNVTNSKENVVHRKKGDD